MPKRRLSRRDPERIGFACEQRTQANEFTHVAWQMLRGGRMLGEKFRREYPLGPCTLDLVRIDLQLNIEIDGKDHLMDEGKHHD